MKKLLLAMVGVLALSAPANAITWNEFWEPFENNHTHRGRYYGGYRHRGHNHCHNHYGRGYSHCHYHNHDGYNGHSHGHRYGQDGPRHYHGHDRHYYDGYNGEIIIR